MLYKCHVYSGHLLNADSGHLFSVRIVKIPLMNGHLKLFHQPVIGRESSFPWLVRQIGALALSLKLQHGLDARTALCTCVVFSYNIIWIKLTYIADKCRMTTLHNKLGQIRKICSLNCQFAILPHQIVRVIPLPSQLTNQEANSGHTSRNIFRSLSRFIVCCLMLMIDVCRQLFRHLSEVIGVWIYKCLMCADIHAEGWSHTWLSASFCHRLCFDRV